MFQISYKRGVLDKYFPHAHNRTITYSIGKSLNSVYNAHCHLMADVAFVEFTASCRWNRCGAEYFCLCLCVLTQGSGGLYHPLATL